MSWLDINEIFKTYTPTLDAFNKLIGISISVGLFWLAYLTNRIAKSNFEIAKSNFELAKQEKQSRKYRINRDEREIFRAVYNNISSALDLVCRNGRVTQEALSLFREARNQAELELPDDIQEYSENLLDLANKTFYIKEIYLFPENCKGLPVDEERNKKFMEHGNYVLSLMREKPHEKFAKYMKVDAA